MNLIDQFLVKRIIAQVEKQIPVTTQPVSTFPAKPDKVLQFRAPSDMKQQIDSKPLEQHPTLDTQNIDLASKVNAMLKLADDLRTFESQIDILKKEQKKAMDALKAQKVGGELSYNQQLAQLEQQVQEVGNAVEGLEQSTEQTVNVLLRTNQYWLQLKKTVTQSQTAPDEYEALKQVLAQEMDNGKLAKIYDKVQRIVKDGTQISYALSKSLTGVPIRDDHRNAQMEGAGLERLVPNFINDCYALMSELLEISTPIEDFVNRAGNKAQQVDFSVNPNQKAASYGGK